MQHLFLFSPLSAALSSDLSSEMPGPPLVLGSGRRGRAINKMRSGQIVSARLYEPSERERGGELRRASTRAALNSISGSVVGETMASSKRNGKVKKAAFATTWLLRSKNGFCTADSY